MPLGIPNKYMSFFQEHVCVFVWVGEGAALLRLSKGGSNKTSRVKHYINMYTRSERCCKVILSPSTKVCACVCVCVCT